MTTLDGKAIDHLKGAPFIISNKACHETVLKILNANLLLFNNRYFVVIKNDKKELLHSSRKKLFYYIINRENRQSM